MKKKKSTSISLNFRLDERIGAMFRALQQYAKRHSELRRGSVNHNVIDACIEWMYAHLANTDQMAITTRDLEEYSRSVKGNFIVYLAKRGKISEKQAIAILEKYISPSRDKLVDEDWSSFFNETGENVIGQSWLPFTQPELLRREEARRLLGSRQAPTSDQVERQLQATYDTAKENA